MDVRWCQGPFDEIIDGVMSHMTTGGFATGKALNTEAVDFGVADAHVRCTHGGPETQWNGHTKGGVIKSRTDCRTRNRVQKITGVWCSSRDKTGAPDSCVCAADITSSSLRLTSGVSHSFWTPILGPSGTTTVLRCFQIRHDVSRITNWKHCV